MPLINTRSERKVKQYVGGFDCRRCLLFQKVDIVGGVETHYFFVRGSTRLEDLHLFVQIVRYYQVVGQSEAVRLHWMTLLLSWMA